MASSTSTNGTTSLVHFLDLDEYGLNEVPSEFRDEAKQDVADYLLNEVLRQLDKGTSPVKGEGRFRILNSKYSKTFKGGVKNANLELEGDLKDSLIVKPATGSFIKFGHEGTEVPKADGHNQISSKSKRWAASMADPKEGTLAFPRRRYIPDSNQKFTETITNEIETIIKEFVPEQGEDGEERTGNDLLNAILNSDKAKISNTKEDINQTSITIDDLFSDDFIEDLLQDALLRGQ